MTVKDLYSLPKIDDCIDSLRDAASFPTMDANSGYWQMKIREKDRPTTAFVAHNVTYQYTRMFFGLTNTSASFKRVLDMRLTKSKRKTCLIYLDEIIVYSNSIEDHIRHIHEVLQALKKGGVKLNIEKSKFFTIKVEYLRNIIKSRKL